LFNIDSLSGLNEAEAGVVVDPAQRVQCLSLSAIMSPRQLWRIHTCVSTGRSDGVQTVGRKTSWAKDVWANYFLGDRRLGDKGLSSLHSC